MKTNLKLFLKAALMFALIFFCGLSAHRHRRLFWLLRWTNKSFLY